MGCRGIRGAITAEANTEEAILGVTRRLYLEILERNAVLPDDVAAVLITCTPDLSATFPARAVRELGHVHVPLTCAQEVDVTGALALCIRILLLANTDKTPSEIQHVYLGEAARLRPDLVRGRT